VATAYLLRKGKTRYGSLITALPAAFMSAVSMTYILMAREGFRLSSAIAYPAGAAFALILLGIYGWKLYQRRRS
jgi:carbon starvation protein CstA